MTNSGCRVQRISGLTLLRALAVLVGVVLAGCVQKTPVPYFARAGDTIVLGLGGIQRNTSGEQHLKQADLSITITPVNGTTPIPLSPTILFKAYPDYASALNFNVVKFSYPFPNFDGGWFVTVDLPDSTTLAPGSYTISVTSPTGKLLNLNYTNGTAISEGDLTHLPLEVIAGDGGNNDYSTQFAAYATSPSLNISPTPDPSSVGLTSVAGMQLAITYPQARYDPTHAPMVVPYSHNPYIQLSQNILDNGNGTKTMIILLSTQQAFVAPANRTPFTPLLNDLSLRIMYFVVPATAPTTAQIVSDFQIDQSRSHYYDTTGAVITAMQPLLSYKAL